MASPWGRGYEACQVAVQALGADLRALAHFEPVTPAYLTAGERDDWCAGWLVAANNLTELLIPEGADPERYVAEHEFDAVDLEAVRAWAEGDRLLSRVNRGLHGEDA